MTAVLQRAGMRAALSLALLAALGAAIAGASRSSQAAVEKAAAPVAVAAPVVTHRSAPRTDPRPVASRLAVAASRPVRRARPVPVALPVSSPWSLPPLLVLEARHASGAHLAALRRQVLRSPRLALSPKARRAVVSGSTTPGALALLLRAPRTGSPLLVFDAGGSQLQVQEITLWMTRRAVRGFAALPAAQRPARLLLEPVASDRADQAGPPRPKAGDLRTLATLYRSAGYQYGLDWRVLAAINRVETNLGRNTHVSSAGAVGWMQFMPSTWRRWGTDANGDGVADPYDATDAVYSAARYLAAAGGERDIRRAVFAYNHADWYVNEVLQIAASIPDDYGQR